MEVRSTIKVGISQETKEGILCERKNGQLEEEDFESRNGATSL